MPLSPSFFTILGSQVAIEDGSTRRGRLVAPGRMPIETPNFLGITSRGAVPHITPDVLSAHTQIRSLHIALEDFIEKSQSSTPPIMNCPAGRKSTPLHNFAALPNSLTTLLAPRRTPAVTAPTGNSHQAIQLFTSVGFQSLTNTAYINYVRHLRPDIVVPLADIAYGTVPGMKRIEKMGDRTSAWVDALLSALAQEESEGSAVFAPVLTVDLYAQAEYLHHLADDLVDELAGLAFYDAALLPDIPRTTAMMRLPRLSLDEPQTPMHLLRQVALGMDLFTVPFVGMATDAGFALTFSLPPASSAPTISSSYPDNRIAPSTTPPQNSSNLIRPLAIPLLSQSQTCNPAPPLPDCACHTCRTHSSAYIAHLLSAHEMLGWVLLQIHNHFVVSTFFADIRRAIEDGTFEDRKYLFEKLWESEFEFEVGGGEDKGVGPRVRGYMRKSGKGEGRRNRPAWGKLGEDGDGDAENDGNIAVDADLNAGEHFSYGNDEGKAVVDENTDENEIVDVGTETPITPHENAAALAQKGFADMVLESGDRK